ncbi:MAG TPA: alpha/beta hydrolase [Oleiagrimonas sp.]|nr:alpha/beta hydrolase [Oleiagrimonas sp.]
MKKHVCTWFALVAMVLTFAAQAQNANFMAKGQTIDLWPGAPPAGSGQAPAGRERVWRTGSGVGAVSNISTPRMVVFRPDDPNGTAIVIMGGGGYFRIGIGHESVPTAKWLLSLGVTPVILYYRLPADGWAPVAPFQDGQRAVRLLRARADELGINPQRIGVLGFSAGGNLAGIVETRFKHDFYAPVDAADSQSSRPDFAALLYPVSSLKPPFDTTRTRRELLPQDNAETAYTVQDHVTSRTPPTFIAHAADDPIVAVQASRLLYKVLREHDVPAQLHVFPHGGHGWGLGMPGTAVGQWPLLFADWLAKHGWLTSAKSASTSSAQSAAN